MTDAHMLQDVSLLVEEQKPFVAATGVNLGLCFRIVAEIPHRDTIGVVLQLGVPAPKLPPRVVPK
jgi:hypothetical protein